MRDCAEVRQEILQIGDLIWILDGARNLNDLIIGLAYGTPYHKWGRDWTWFVLVEGDIRKYKGWRLERIY